MFNRGLHGRVSGIEQRQERLETTVDGLRADVGGLVSAIGDQGDKVDQLVRGLSTETTTVKNEIREENDRKSRDRSSLLRDGLALVGTVIVIVGAFCGPYLAKINATSDSASDLVVKVGAIREVLAQQGADVGRNHDAIDIAREKNRLQDEQLRQNAQDIAFMQGVMADRGWPHR